MNKHVDRRCVQEPSFFWVLTPNDPGNDSTSQEEEEEEEEVRSRWTLDAVDAADGWEE